MNGLAVAIEEMAKAVRGPNELTRAIAKDQCYTLYPDTRYPWQVRAKGDGSIEFRKETHVNTHLMVVSVKPKKIRRGR